MTRIAIRNQRPASSTVQLRAALCVAAALSCLCAPAHAAEYASSPGSREVASAGQPAADLEKAFWACDYAATTRWVGMDEGAMCGANYEELKKSKFGGDFPALLRWWQQNKAARHQALATAGRRGATP